MPIQLGERLWLVGGGLQGFGLTNDYDCNVYLVDCGPSAVLLDCGAGLEPERLDAEIAATGVGDKLSHVLLTHGHADHAGGAAYLRRCHRCIVAASPEVAGYLERADSAAIGLDLAREAGIYPDNYAWEGCTVDVVLHDGVILGVGACDFAVLSTPGHSAGHLSFLLSTPQGDVLFSGDAVFHNGEILLQALPDCSIWDYRQTIARLAALNVSTLLPGHGTLALRNGQAHIEMAEQAFRTLLPPRNLVSV